MNGSHVEFGQAAVRARSDALDNLGMQARMQPLGVEFMKHLSRESKLMPSSIELATGACAMLGGMLAQMVIALTANGEDRNVALNGLIGLVHHVAETTIRDMPKAGT